VFLLRYIIPSAITNRATDIKEKLDLLISKLGTTGTNTTRSATNGSSSSSFSVTDHFFVSSFIARKRQDIPEGLLVLSYRSSIPKDVNTKFNGLIKKRHDTTSNTTSTATVNNTFTGIDSIYIHTTITNTTTNRLVCLLIKGTARHIITAIQRGSSSSTVHWYTA
jgi:hypothetical protein